MRNSDSAPIVRFNSPIVNTNCPKQTKCRGGRVDKMFANHADDPSSILSRVEVKICKNREIISESLIITIAAVPFRTSLRGVYETFYTHWNSLLSKVF